MNTLSLQTKALILSQIVEGLSVRAIERLTGVHRDTIVRLMLSAGNSARDILDRELVDLEIKRLQVDEIWAYVCKKQAHLTPDDPAEYGDAYTFIALDPDTKLIPAFLVGKRTSGFALAFLKDLRYRIRTRCQLSTDAFSAYIDAVDRVFGEDIDFAQVHKSFSSSENVIQSEHRYRLPIVSASVSDPSRATPSKSIFRLALSNGITLPCVCKCAVLLGLRTPFLDALPVLRPLLLFTFFITTLCVFINPSELRPQWKLK